MANEAAPIAPTTSAEPGTEGTTDAAPPTEGVVSSPDSAPEDDKAVPTEKETSFMRNLRKQEDRVVVEKRRLAEERNATKAEREQLAKERAAVDSERAERAARDKMFRDDPLGYAMQHLGIRDEDLARRWVRGNKPSQEELEHQREQSFRDELKKRDDQIAAIKADQDARKAQEKAAADAAQNKAGIDAFTARANATAAKLPNVAHAIKNAPETLLEDADAIAATLKRQGKQWPTLEALHDDVLLRVEAKYAKIRGVAVTPVVTLQDSEQADPPGPRVDPKTAPTLTGKTSSQRSSTPPADDPLLDVIDRERGRKRTLKAIDDAEAAFKAARH